ncbi:Superoxide dismutase (Fe) [Liberibacter crescens BT-1]|uniref:Superoxide dismutase n=1 Tax=Liberibacter crescens (strain BT-1) TaxID=1215343 RepID=L0EUD7_LIBCB|nr:superoxide dismutase [Liberibacter crescens]AGA64278.1 Superoxide dismutase (Fe) [Liberibacter crescens BT-1]AMC12508.1 superoxide dismutase [Liberibacter crescens]
MPFELPDLPYDYDALEPYMSRKTLECHHGKHHKTYAENSTKLAADSGMSDLSIEEIILKSYGLNSALFNNISQHYNHKLFWTLMKKGGGGKKLPSILQSAIDSDLGGYEKFKSDFITAGTTQFGAGWCWVSVKNNKLEISKTQNGENPLLHGAKPILGIDVWEHAYYLDYYNMRTKYLEAFVDYLINWEQVLELYEKAINL